MGGGEEERAPGVGWSGGDGGCVLVADDNGSFGDGDELVEACLDGFADLGKDRSSHASQARTASLQSVEHTDQIRDQRLGVGPATQPHRDRAQMRSGAPQRDHRDRLTGEHPGRDAVTE